MAPGVFSCSMKPILIQLVCGLWGLLLNLQCCSGKIELKVSTYSAAVDDNMYFEMVEPEAISYTYRIRPAKGFGIQLNETIYHAELVPVSPLHGCSTLDNSESIVGNIALIRRGECSFLSKTLNAQHAGARLAVIFDHEPTYDGRMIDMIHDETDRKVSIPAFYLQGLDGKMILETLEELQLESAVINIPVNVTGIAIGHIKQPPWTLW